MTVRERRPGGTRERILEVAKELFGQVGFDSTTVKEIADRVGLSDAALYYHFKNKREILEAIWEMPVGAGLTEIKPDQPLTPSRLREIIDTTLDLSVRNGDFSRLVLREVLAGDETAMALRSRNRSLLRRILFEHLATVFTVTEAELRADAILLLFIGSTMKLQIGHGPGFAHAANDPVYREQLQQKVQDMAGLDRAMAS